jgi:hypothetical protein
MSDHDDRVSGVRMGLIDYLSEAASFRENLIPEDQPWNPKNERHAACLKSVLEYANSLPCDHPAFLKLADKLAGYDYMFDEDDGAFLVPDKEWEGVIHCSTDNPAAWFDIWVESLGPVVFELIESDEAGGFVTVKCPCCSHEAKAIAGGGGVCCCCGRSVFDPRIAGRAAGR